MGTQFTSTSRRAYWLSVLFGLVTDGLIAYLAALAFGSDAFAAVGVGALILVAVYAFQMLYGLISLCRYAALFFLFDKRRRIATTVGQMEDAGMPLPGRFYGDPTEYLREVVSDKEAPPNAKLMAGATIGALETLRATNHAFLAMCLMMVVEQAIAKYSERQSLAWRQSFQEASAPRA
ncbi:hypothetical protein [Mesorhizobium sp.]|uniref:hypothetical protein n=1 Tax=Mesorhizobium sp. TaxID=1871066 RepID=UPI000FE7A9C5|nr:hypothetical protein [Mesorhizobium sp.]RWD74270.1 MAG: hypothetical protein EOS37_03390 [Mesorhizobium sp.]